MSNPLVAELNAMAERLIIIKDNVSDKLTQQLTEECLSVMANIHFNVTTALNSSNEQDDTKENPDD